MADEIPAVCFIRDVCRALRMSRTTLKRLRRHGAFPIPELPALDKHPRWSGAEVQKFLERPVVVARKPWKRTA
jgi:hypothetical protein